jgi:hypothetical protein
MSIPTADNIVFNLTLYNPDPVESIQAEKYISRDQLFVKNIENYYLRLMSAEISTSEIPLFIYNNDMYVEINNVRVLVNFSNPYNDNFVYFVQQFLNGVNTALTTAHTTSGAPGNPPLIIYEDRFKILIDQLYTPGTDYIAFNSILIDKFPSIDSYYNSFNDMFNINYDNYGNNLFNSYPGGVNYPIYLIVSPSEGFYTLSEILNIVVTSNSIPINKQQITSLGISTRTLGILDIIPIDLDDVTRFTVKNYRQDFPSYVDLLSRGQLSEIDFKIYTVDKNFVLRPLTIAPKTSVNCRFEFVNKEIIKNYYPITDAR